MRIGYQYYQFTEKKFFDAIELFTKRRRAVLKAAKAFAKKYGADTREYASTRGDGELSIRGFFFDKAPDSELWMRPSRDDRRLYRPKKTSKAIKIFREFAAIPKADMAELRDLCHYKLAFNDGYVYFFAPFWTEDRKFAGIRVPIFDSGSCDEDPYLRYKAPKGMKKISVEHYDREVAKATLRKKRKK